MVVYPICYTSCIDNVHKLSKDTTLYTNLSLVSNNSHSENIYFLGEKLHSYYMKLTCKHNIDNDMIELVNVTFYYIYKCTELIKALNVLYIFIYFWIHCRPCNTPNWIYRATISKNKHAMLLSILSLMFTCRI